MTPEKAWFRTIHQHTWASGTVWYWDGERSWYSPRTHEMLQPSYFDPARMRANPSFQEIPNPWAPPVELRLPEGL